MPLTTADGHVLGALCAIDSEPRTWLPSDAAVMRDLATVTMSEVTLRRLAREVSERMRSEIVARDAAETKARRLEAMRQLANDVAHEFAGIMQSVQSGVRLASSRLDRDPATAQSILALVGDVARRGGALSERLLAFTPRGELQAERVNVETLLRQLGKGLSSTSGSHVRTSVEVDPCLPPVLADPEELTAVLLALTGLARTAMPEGGTLRIAAGLDVVARDITHPARLSPGRYVRLSVADTGTGVANQEQATSGGSVSNMGGVGLDMVFEFALAHELMEQLGGGMIQESRPGVGTTVRLWLPAANADRTEDAG
jgi:signal transduction histidine kinase